jgi:hypothetical protein
MKGAPKRDEEIEVVALAAQRDAEDEDFFFYLGSSISSKKCIN